MNQMHCGDLMYYEFFYTDNGSRHRSLFITDQSRAGLINAIKRRVDGQGYMDVALYPCSVQRYNYLRDINCCMAQFVK